MGTNLSYPCQPHACEGTIYTMEWWGNLSRKTKIGIIAIGLILVYVILHYITAKAQIENAIDTVEAAEIEGKAAGDAIFRSLKKETKVNFL